MHFNLISILAIAFLAIMNDNHYKLNEKKYCNYRIFFISHLIPSKYHYNYNLDIFRLLDVIYFYSQVVFLDILHFILDLF